MKKSNILLTTCLIVFLYLIACGLYITGIQNQYRQNRPNHNG